MAYKVIVWGTGAVGKMVIDEILDNPEYELVGVLVNNPDKVGVDAGTLIGRDPIDILCTDDADAVLALDADVVAYFGPTAGFAQDNIVFLKGPIPGSRNSLVSVRPAVKKSK